MPRGDRGVFPSSPQQYCPHLQCPPGDQTLQPKPRQHLGARVGVEAVAEPMRMVPKRATIIDTRCKNMGVVFNIRYRCTVTYRTADQ